MMFFLPLHAKVMLLSTCWCYQVLLQGIPREGTLVDIERFLSGCQYDASSIDMFMRLVPARFEMSYNLCFMLLMTIFQGLIIWHNWWPCRAAIKDKLATVRFLTQTQAMNCFITKNKGYCLNNQVLVRVLQWRKAFVWSKPDTFIQIWSWCSIIGQ